MNAETKKTDKEIHRIAIDARERAEIRGVTDVISFDEREVVAIKAFFGPWPRALEAAGVKPPRDDDRQQKNREKRIRAKQNRMAAMRRAESEKKEPYNEQKN